MVLGIFRSHKITKNILAPKDIYAKMRRQKIIKCYQIVDLAYIYGDKCWILKRLSLCQAYFVFLPGIHPSPTLKEVKRLLRLNSQFSDLCVCASLK